MPTALSLFTPPNPRLMVLSVPRYLRTRSGAFVRFQQQHHKTVDAACSLLRFQLRRQRRVVPMVRRWTGTRINARAKDELENGRSVWEFQEKCKCSFESVVAIGARPLLASCWSVFLVWRPGICLQPGPGARTCRKGWTFDRIRMRGWKRGDSHGLFVSAS